MKVITVFSQFPHVPRIKPSVANPRCGCLWLAKVAFHNVRPAGDDLSGLTRWNLVAILVHDPNLYPRNRVADATHLGNRLTRFDERNQGRCFRKSESLD